MKFDLTKILELYNNLNDKMRYGIFAGVVFLVILLDLFLVALPQLGSITSMNDQIKKMSDDTHEVIVDKQRIGLLRKNLQESRNKASALSIKVRPIQEVPAILSAISSDAKEFGVKIDQLTPEYNQVETLNTVGDTKYYALPVLIRAHCGYHNLGHFLNEMENGDMFFMMKDFIIQNTDKTTSVHSIDMTIKIVLLD